MNSRAKAVVSTLAALLPAALAGAPSVAALTLPPLPAPPLPAVPSPKGEVHVPSVEVHTPAPAEVKTPVVSVTPSPETGVTVTVPSGSAGGVKTPPVEVSTPPVNPPPPVQTLAPPPLPTPSPPHIPVAVPTPVGLPGGGPAGQQGGGSSASAASTGSARLAGSAIVPAASQAQQSGRGLRSRSGGRHATATSGRRSAAGRGGARGAATARPLTPAAAALAAGSPLAAGGITASRSVHAPGGSDPLTSIGRNIPFPVPVPDWSKPIILALLLLALALGIRAAVAARRARRLERQREALLRDIDALQAALVPEIPRQLENLAVSVAYRPAEGPAAGGDFYDVFSASPGRVAVILGDVAGHGHEALRHAALIRYTLRAYIQAGLEPRTALALAGRALEQPIGEHCATVAVGVYDRRGSRFTYALAGHPAPILRGVPVPEPLTACSSPPIGWSLPTGRRQSEVTLPPGSEVCLFSDGLIEARAGGGFVGRDGLTAMIDELGARTNAADLLEQVQARARATPDDMAACILRPQTNIPPERWHVEELEVDAEAMEGDAGGRFLTACAIAPPTIERTLALAESILASSATVVLRVETSARGTAVSAAAPAAGASDAGAPAARSGGNGEPGRRAGDVAATGDGPRLLL
jgi:serine phosphatase RsbU (regulator of sigma subunit)